MAQRTLSDSIEFTYADDDTEFNESFATAVERIGSARWLATQATPAAREEIHALFAAALSAAGARIAHVTGLGAAREALAAAAVTSPGEAKLKTYLAATAREAAELELVKAKTISEKVSAVYAALQAGGVAHFGRPNRTLRP